MGIKALITGVIALSASSIVSVSGAECWPAVGNGIYTNGAGLEKAWGNREYACNQDASENILAQCAMGLGRSDASTGGNWWLDPTYISGGYYREGPWNGPWPNGKRALDTRGLPEGLVEHLNLTGTFGVTMFDSETKEIISEKLYMEDGSVKDAPERPADIE
ncbi:hypothetical protein BKA61DRAFT_584023 [Leptodontidium sp. MPI-SDFR-AT-0119]|nr:hypothetical protein BKA61DRAFT_584023 [Leptodontidium sp. MPI-SDFR-AT-0119]